MRCLLVLIAAIFAIGCSVGVTHQTEDENHDDKSSTVERSRTTVTVGVLTEPTALHEPNAPNTNQSPSAERSYSTVTVIVPESSSEVANITRSPNRSIRVTGGGNVVVLGDVNIHHHSHFYIHQTPKPPRTRIDVRFEMDDGIGERERRRRMVQKRIAKFFPRYRN